MQEHVENWWKQTNFRTCSEQLFCSTALQYEVSCIS